MRPSGIRLPTHPRRDPTAGATHRRRGRPAGGLETRPPSAQRARGSSGCEVAVDVFDAATRGDAVSAGVATYACWPARRRTAIRAAINSVTTPMPN